MVCKHLMQVSEHSLLVLNIVAEMVRNQDTAADIVIIMYTRICMYNNQVSHVPCKHLISIMSKVLSLILDDYHHITFAERGCLHQAGIFLFL